MLENIIGSIVFLSGAFVCFVLIGRLRSENIALRESIEELKLRLRLSKGPYSGSLQEITDSFCATFQRRTSVVPLSPGCIVVFHDGGVLDESALLEWGYQFLPVSMVAQFCTTSELQSWLERRQ